MMTDNRLFFYLSRLVVVLACFRYPYYGVGTTLICYLCYNLYKESRWGVEQHYELNFRRFVSYWWGPANVQKNSLVKNITTGVEENMTKVLSDITEAFNLDPSALVIDNHKKTLYGTFFGGYVPLQVVEAALERCLFQFYKEYRDVIIATTMAEITFQQKSVLSGETNHVYSLLFLLSNSMKKHLLVIFGMKIDDKGILQIDLNSAWIQTPFGTENDKNLDEVISRHQTCRTF